MIGLSRSKKIDFYRKNLFPILRPGFVSDDSTGLPIHGAVIRVEVARRSKAPSLIRHDVTSGVDGDYWRLLVPGGYRISASAPGYEGMTVPVTVIDGPARRVSFLVAFCPSSIELEGM